jgi:type II secretory pathway pseudopilin PulG
VNPRTWRADIRFGFDKLRSRLRGCYTMKDRTWVTQLIIQPIMIIVSILAALAVNNWQESRAKVKRQAEARSAFVNEISANKQLLLSADYLPHHRRLQGEYAAASKQDGADPGTFFETGVHPTPLRDSAWRMLSGTGTLMELPSGFVLALTDIYRLQDSIEKRNEGFLNSLGSPRSDRETPAYAKDLTRSIHMFLNDLVPAEEMLLRSYDRALERFSSEKAP